ncbi:hypothetical protein [Vibrio parahaemolyticus]|uniref:hypothetical protein n=1 Tax=Vibrio parahaemolyticus TaxID=670 RepID=UPI00038E158C|nr:hypothetical protein [Vibrio parahaemolyticus]KIT45223.1 molecular chaperone [Vibrio parahaemolyticus EN9701121]ANQ58864.1 hypothetical protein AB831_22225 [Vibrio parahaemolyticus]ASO14069.1 hypothetical protein BGM07_006640 [Vibrio parahaemolyticus]ATA65987.1 hypothetical protein MAVP-QPI_00039 [Vibrio parahaemolyticus]EGQ7717418.1 hypothetical protein [Vibrio parahaemolyticus]
MLNINLNATNQSVATSPLTATKQDSTLPESVLALLNDSTTLEAPYSPETLQTQLQQQKAALKSTAPNLRSTESNISDSLLAAIDQSAVELELIGMWAEGGQAGFQAALELIGQPLLGLTNPQDSQLEDIFQLAMLDLLINAKEYGVDTDATFMQKLSFCLEYIGSGQHNSWVEALPPANNMSGSATGGISGNHLLNMAKHVWSKMAELVSNGTASQESLLYRAMSKLTSGPISASQSFPRELETLLTTSGSTTSQLQNSGYFDTTKGGWITTNNNNMSPLIRLVFLSNMLKDNPEMSKATLETILKGSLKDINDLTPTGGNYQHVYDYISKFGDPDIFQKGQMGWQNSSYGENGNGDTTGGKRPNGVNIALDFDGSLNASWLKALYQNYPQRVLGDEDTKEINRIGDNVKMIQQTLKYWYQILRDERLAIARNI